MTVELAIICYLMDWEATDNPFRLPAQVWLDTFEEITHTDPGISGNFDPSLIYITSVLNRLACDGHIVTYPHPTTGEAAYATCYGRDRYEEINEINQTP